MAKTKAKDEAQIKSEALKHINKLTHTLDRLVKEYRDEYETQEPMNTRQKLRDLHQAISNYIHC